MSGIYGDVDMARVMYGDNARHVPAWMYVQDQGPSVVAVVGGSMTPGQDHPLTYGGGHYDRSRKWNEPQRDGYYSHHFIVGEIIVRPHVVIGTNALVGEGLGGLATGSHDLGRMLSNGSLVVGSDAALNRIRRQWEA